MFGKITSIYAETTPYHSAGWVGTTGYTAYSSVTGCQASNDGLYCSRSYADFNGELYFGSFGNLEDFGIPLNSYIDNLRIRVKGKATADQSINVVSEYNQKNISYFCQTSPNLPTIYLGPIDKTIEISKPIVIGDGFAYCFTKDNINFRNLTFQLKAYPPSKWSADIDNFEIAFDYTPPAVAPTPVVFSENQKGTVWEIGPDKSELKLVVGLENIVSVVTGSAHSLALKSDGTIWAWGRNQEGQLGNGNSGANMDTPAQVKGPNGVGYLTGVKKIAAGAVYSMALKKDGTIWIWGSNSYGFLGTGGGANDSGNKLLFPTQVISGYFTNPVDIAAGDRHSLILNSDGTVVGWGQNNNGQIGNGCFLYNCSSVLFPTQIQNVNNIIAISAGYAHSLALSGDGIVWGWGASGSGQLGEAIRNISTVYSERPNPSKIIELSNIKKISSRGSYSLAVNAQGDLIEWGNGISIPKKVPDISDTVSISAGSSGFSYGVKGHVLKSDGTLWQLYINDIPPKQVPVLKNVVAVASGNQTASLAVINTGDVLGTSVTPTPSVSPSPTPVPGPQPFLDLPWNYVSKSKSFDSSALAINTYFDHSYPLLSSGLSEPSSASANKTSFRNFDEPDGYSIHDGYDWGIKAGVLDGDFVLAAASGSASIILAANSGGAGNVVKIDHGNGYQTWYEHLYPDGLASGNVGKGDKIGRVGHFGNCYVQSNGKRFYNTPACAHIHFGVFQDKNNDGNFVDNIPDGVTDPFGWMPTVSVAEKALDPWENYTFLQNGIEKKGNKSNYLWIKKIDGFREVLTNLGKTIDVGSYSLYLPSDGQLNGLTLDAQLEPSVNSTDKIIAIGPGIKITLKDALKNFITNLNKPMKITISFVSDDIENVKKDSLAIYSSNDLKVWKKENSIIDLLNSKITIEVSHLTHFALMGERVDTIAPTTTAQISGEKGQENWFRSAISLALIVSDNEGGLGIDNTQFMTEGKDWQQYRSPLLFSDEAHYKISYYSQDKDGNTEDVRTTEFDIDKTPPNQPTSTPIGGEFVTSQSVNLVSTDDRSGIAGIYYTLDGSVPNSLSLVYIGPINVSKDMTIKAVAYDKAGNSSSIVNTSYKILSPISNISIVSGDQKSDGGSSVQVRALSAAITQASGSQFTSLEKSVLGDSTTSENVKKDNSSVVLGDKSVIQKEQQSFFASASGKGLTIFAVLILTVSFGLWVSRRMRKI